MPSAARKTKGKGCQAERIRTVQDATTRLVLLRDQRHDLVRIVAMTREAGASATCPTCAMFLPGGPRTGVIDLLEEQLAEIQTGITYFQQRLERLGEPAPAENPESDATGDKGGRGDEAPPPDEYEHTIDDFPLDIEEPEFADEDFAAMMAEPEVQLVV